MSEQISIATDLDLRHLARIYEVSAPQQPSFLPVNNFASAYAETVLEDDVVTMLTPLTDHLGVRSEGQKSDVTIRLGVELQADAPAFLTIPRLNTTQRMPILRFLTEAEGIGLAEDLETIIDINKQRC